MKEEEKEEVEEKENIIRNKGAGENIITTKQTGKDRLMQNMERLNQPAGCPERPGCSRP